MLYLIDTNIVSEWVKGSIYRLSGKLPPFSYPSLGWIDSTTADWDRAANSGRRRGNKANSFPILTCFSPR